MGNEILWFVFGIVCGILGTIIWAVSQSKK